MPGELGVGTSTDTRSRSGRRLTVFLVRGLLSYIAFALALVYCFWRVIMTQLFSRERATIARDTARVMARLVCPAAGVRVVVTGDVHLCAARPCVYVANHQSYLDYPILATIFPLRTAIVGKAEIGRIPLIGWLFAITGNVLLSRHDARSASDTIAALARRVQVDGTSIWMFPEGTRRRSAVPMLAFRTGAFRVAQAAQVPIVPVVVASLTPRIDIARWHAESATIAIHVLTPRWVTPSDDVRECADQTRIVMVETFLRLSEREAGHDGGG